MRRRQVVRHVAAGILAGIGIACAGRDTGVTPEFRVQFEVSNRLLAPVAIAIDGVAHLNLSGGGRASLSVPSFAQWLSWNSAKPMDSEGEPIQDDIGEVIVSVSGINGALEITNVIQDQTYITAQIHNLTTAPVSIGVFDGTGVSCAARLPAASSSRTGYTQIGYYRLLPATELRAYRDPAACSGAYVPWTPAEIKNFAPKSGLVVLTLESAP
jgi:hypothetical protein